MRMVPQDHIGTGINAGVGGGYLIIGNDPRDPYDAPVHRNHDDIDLLLKGFDIFNYHSQVIRIWFRNDPSGCVWSAKLASGGRAEWGDSNFVWSCDAIGGQNRAIRQKTDFDAV